MMRPTDSTSGLKAVATLPPFVLKLGIAQIAVAAIIAGICLLPFPLTVTNSSSKSTFVPVVVAMILVGSCALQFTRYVNRMRTIRVLRRLCAVFWFLTIVSFPYFLFARGARYVALNNALLEATVAWVGHGLLLVSAVAYTAWLGKSARVPKAGICRGCGYDLRASPDRCPECGMEPLATASPLTSHQ